MKVQWLQSLVLKNTSLFQFLSLDLKAHVANKLSDATWLKKKKLHRTQFLFLIALPSFLHNFLLSKTSPPWHPHRKRWPIKPYFVIYQNLVQRGKNNEILFSATTTRMLKPCDGGLLQGWRWCWLMVACVDGLWLV